MRLSFEYSTQNKKDIDCLIANYAAGMLMRYQLAAQDTRVAYGWLAFNAQRDQGLVGVVIDSDVVFLERHSHAYGHRPFHMSPKQPVGGQCNALDCSINIVGIDGLISHMDIGYRGGATSLWPAYDAQRIIAGRASWPGAERKVCTMSGDERTVGLRLAEQSQLGHVIHSEALGALATTKYARYYT